MKTNVDEFISELGAGVLFDERIVQTLIGTIK